MTLPRSFLIAVLVIIRRSIRCTCNPEQSMQRFVGLGNSSFLFKRETFWLVVKQSCIFAITAVSSRR